MTSPAVVTPIDGSPAQVRRAAKAYAEAGRSVVMCWGTGEEPKKPTHGWKEFESRCQTPEEIDRQDGGAVALICGKVSGNLECIDFDDKGSRYVLWCELVEAEAPGLLDRLTVEQSPSGGYHVTYLCPGAVIACNTELARKGPEKKDLLIETRGEGGYFLCAPSPGYKLLKGNHRDKLVVITPEERQLLLSLARGLNEYIKPSDVVGDDGRQWRPGSNDRPGDAFNANPDPTPYDMLLEQGWKPCGGRGKYEHFTRPGKERGVSGSLIDGRVFYPFSSNSGLEPNKPLSPFALFAHAYFDDDFHEAAKVLYGKGYGKRRDGEKQEKEAEPDPWDAVDFMDYRIGRYLDAPPPAIDYVITGLPVGCVGGIIAPPGAGKTHFAQAIAGAVATGQASIADDIFEIPKQGRVLVISAEDREWAVHDRIWRGFGSVFDPFDAEEAERAAQIKADLRENMIVFPAKGRDLSLIAQGQSGWTSTHGYESLLAKVQKVPNLRLIVLDPLARFFTANENDNPAGTYFCVLLERIAKATGSAILINHHTNKGSSRPGKDFILEAALHQDAARGASALTGAWDWQYNLCPLPGKFASSRLGVQARDEEYLAGRASKVRFGRKGDITFFKAGEAGMLVHLEDKFVKEKMSTNAVLRKRIIEEVKRKEEAGEKRISITTLAKGFASEWKDEGATRDKLEALAKVMVSDGTLTLVPEKQGHRVCDYLALGVVEESGEESEG